MRYIDLRSDTVTQPTEEMRQAMLTVEVGDDVYNDDPTITKLEELAAKITGKEAALFTPSGTMANQLAVMTHTNRGDEVILGENSHIVVHEVGGASVISQIGYRIIKNPDDSINACDVQKAIRPDDIHVPTTGLLCLENALANGTVVGLKKMEEAYGVAKTHDIPVHLDGARIFNAATYLGVEVSEIAKYTDTLMFCLSKGLCSPVGSILCGDKRFIAKARKNRKLLGGGMRQAGFLAAAGIISLEKMTKRLHIDHDNAKYLGEALSKLSFIKVDLEKIHINIVFFFIEKEGFDHDNFADNMLKKGIKINGREDDGSYRFVTHNDITREDIDTVIGILRS